MKGALVARRVDTSGVPRRLDEPLAAPARLFSFPAADLNPIDPEETCPSLLDLA